MQAMVGLTLFWLAASRAQAITTVPQSIPFKQEAASGVGELLRAMGGLALCVLILIGVLYFLRRRAAKNCGGTAAAKCTAGVGRLRMVDRLRLGARSSLVVVEYEGKCHVLAQTDQSIALIATVCGTSVDDGSKAR
jgi:flagellar biogenesis protein FliO